MANLDDMSIKDEQKTPLPPTRRRRSTESDEFEKRESREYVELTEKGLREKKDQRESDPDGIMKPLD